MQFKSYLLARACHVEDVHMLLKQPTAVEASDSTVQRYPGHLHPIGSAEDGVVGSLLTTCTGMLCRNALTVSGPPVGPQDIRHNTETET